MVIRKTLEKEMLNHVVTIATEPNVIELFKRVKALEKEKKRKRETVRKYSQEGKKEGPKKKKLRKEKTYNQPFTQQEAWPTSTERFCDYCDVKRHITQACFKLKKHKRKKAKQQSEVSKPETRKREDSISIVPNSNNMMQEIQRIWQFLNKQ